MLLFTGPRAAWAAWRNRGGAPKAPSSYSLLTGEGAAAPSRAGLIDVERGTEVRNPAASSSGRDASVSGRDLRVTVQQPPLPPRQIVVGNVPQEPPAFLPREDLLSQLRGSDQGTSVAHALTGMLGVGKTQLAAAYARECINAGWRLVAWINAETMEQVRLGLQELAIRLDVDTAEASLDQIGQRVRNRLDADGDRCLVVFDNVTDVSGLRPFVPSSKCQVILTSTKESAASLGSRVQVPVLTDDQSLAFLAERTGSDDEDGARELSTELGCLPVSLAQAAALIVAQRLTYRAYIDRLCKLRLDDYLTPAKDDPYPRGTAEAILLSIDSVRDSDSTRLCLPLMDLISLLSPSGVSRDLLYAAGRLGALAEPGTIGLIRRKMRGEKYFSEDRIDFALGHLASASLVSFVGADRSIVAAHRLVTRVVRERLVRDKRLLARGLEAYVLLRSAGDPQGFSLMLQKGTAHDFLENAPTLFMHLTAHRQPADFVLGEVWDDASSWMGSLMAWFVQFNEARLAGREDLARDILTALEAGHGSMLVMLPKNSKTADGISQQDDELAAALENLRAGLELHYSKNANARRRRRRRGPPEARSECDAGMP